MSILEEGASVSVSSLVGWLPGDANSDTDLCSDCALRIS